MDRDPIRDYSNPGPAHHLRVLFRKATAPLDRLLVGRHFGGYTIDKLLGQGRFGSCFRAQGPNGHVALKLIKPRKGRMDTQAIWTECRSLQACNHPSIPQWLGIVNTDRIGQAPHSNPVLGRKPYFIVEELMPGASIAFWLQKAGHVFRREEILRIAEQLCDVLEHLQQRGIVHADLRPANVLYDGQRISLIDFGLALDAQDSQAFAIDRDGLACVVLFMLYSDPKIIIPGIDATWREELRIPQTLRQCLEDLFDEHHPWESTAQMKTRLLDALQEGEASPAYSESTSQN